ETVRDVLSGDAAGVERPHRELGARLADRLGGDDAYRLADLHQTPGREIAAVAQAADAVDGLARRDGADVDLSDARVGQPRERRVVELVALRRDLLALNLHVLGEDPAEHRGVELPGRHALAVRTLHVDHAGD